MRRIPAILASAAAMAVVVPVGGWGAGPAAAHSCATPSLLTVGAPAVITVGVAAEAVAVDEVTIIVPPQLRIDDVDEANGWTATRTGTSIEYRGGRIEPLGCFSFTIRGTVTKRGTFVLPLQLHFEDGTVQTLSGKDLGAPDSGQVILAGTGAEGAADGVPDRGTSPVQVALVVGFAAAGAVMVFFVVRRTSRPSESDA